MQATNEKIKTTPTTRELPKTKHAKNSNKIDPKLENRWKFISFIKLFMAIILGVILLFIPFGNTNGVYADSTLSAIIKFFSSLGKYSNSIYFVVTLSFATSFSFIIYGSFPYISSSKPGKVNFWIIIILKLTIAILLFIALNSTFANHGFSTNVYSFTLLFWGLFDIIFTVCRRILLTNFKKATCAEIFESLTAIILIAALLLVYIPNGVYNRFANIYGDHNFQNIELGESVGFVEDPWDPNNFVVGNHTVYFHSKGYEYWSTKKQELKKEVQELSPDSIDEEEITEYLQKISNLNNEISKIESNLQSLKNEFVKITTKRWKKSIHNGDIYFGSTTTQYRNDVIEIIYDACPTNKTKWNNTENSSFLSSQSISLTHTEFQMDTNFASEEIGATIMYYDGSVKKAYINPSNIEELNSASKGTCLLKWSDSWGNYEYEIKII
ncbi:MAG: hypothetical protein IJX05_03370 [Clostridia bacterium]|nr:hypothetical protein [Clostridia bacterium]